MNNPEAEKWKKMLVGKMLIRNGASVPTNLNKQETIQESEITHDRYRIIAPGTGITKDFKPFRLNIHVDDKNIVTSVNFG